MATKKKPRKWSNLKGIVPEVKIERSDRVVEEKDKLNGLSMQALADKWMALEAEDKAAEAAQRERNIVYDALEWRIRELLKEVEDVSGTDIWRGVGKTFSPKLTPLPVIKDKAALVKWAKDNGHEYLFDLDKGAVGELIKAVLDVNEVVGLTAEQRANLKQGDAGSLQPPPGVEVYLKPGINHTTT